MDLTTQLAALKTRTLEEMAKAVQEGDVGRVEYFTKLFKEIEASEATATRLEQDLKRYGELLDTRGPALPPTASRQPPRKEGFSGLDRRQHRQRAREERQRLAREYRLTPVRGAIFRTRAGSLVGIAAASEKDNKWWLGIPDEQFGCTVLLLFEEGGKCLHFVLPFDAVSGIWQSLSRGRGQVKVNVRKEIGSYLLLVPGRYPYDISRFLNDYAPLQR